MDSNVSKNTNSHNFFKLRLDREKLDISVQDLLSRELLLSLTLYRQKFNVQIEQSLVAIIIKKKTVISDYKNSVRSSKNVGTSIFGRRKSLSIGYECPVGLSLATTLQQPPAIIVKRIGNLLTSKQQNNYEDLKFELSTEILATGWINFYLNPQFTASWLNRLLCLSRTMATSSQQLETTDSSLDRRQAGLFSLQYLHARCCSLLALGMRENSIILDPVGDRLKYPESIAWLDKQQNLWLSEPAEYDLLRQLLIVTDAWVGDNGDRQWTKLALNLSKATTAFLADCRFLGEVKAQYPQMAIARLGLIALVQFWLKQILIEKFGIAAPKSM